MSVRRSAKKNVAPETEAKLAAMPADHAGVYVPNLGRRVKELRGTTKMTLKEVSARATISMSTLSKLENNQLSPTYEIIVRLAHGLGVDIASLFTDAQAQSVTGRRSITLNGTGIRHETPNYIYSMLCTDLLHKRMIPALVQVRKHEIRSFGHLISHQGDDLLFVVSGEIILHTEFYEPTRLGAGDCAYFDSRMGHGCVSRGVEDAVVFWVSTGETGRSGASAEAGPPG